MTGELFWKIVRIKCILCDDMKKLLLIIVLLFTFSVNASVLFRYNSDIGSDSPVQSPAIRNQVSVQEYLPESEIVARGPSGWGFQTMNTTLFDHDSAYIHSKNEINSTFFNDHAFSGEIWFKPDSLNGNLMTLINSDDEIMISLTLSDGKINFKRNLQNRIFEIQSPDSCPQNEWNYIHWINGTEMDTIYQKLYLNQQLIAYERKAVMHYPLGFEVTQGYLKIGFDDSVDGSSYRGEIYAAEFKNIDFGSAYNDAYYTSDGSAYFGIPAYRYYASGSDIRQKTIRSSKVPVVNTIFVPYSNDGYIPQGLTNSYEDDEFTGDSGLVYISLYHREIDGTIRNKRSIIVELDPLNGYQVRRCFRLNAALETAHVSAMAFRGGNIILTNGGVGYKFEIPEYSGAGTEKYQTLNYVRSVDMYSSSATYYSDSIWCCTKFAQSSSETAYLAGYPIDSLGNVDHLTAPKYFMMPMYVQGAAWTRFQGEDYLFVAASYGDRDSKLYRYSRKNLSRWFLADPDTIFYLPAGLEDVTFTKGGDLMTSSESSALYYSSRASNPWTQFFPFIFKIPREVLFADLINGSTGIHPENHGTLLNDFELSTYPNPFNSQLTIRYQIEPEAACHINIFDLTGRIVDSFSKHNYRNSPANITWNAADISSGVYFIQLVVDNIPTQSRKVVLLK